MGFLPPQRCFCPVDLLKGGIRLSGVAEGLVRRQLAEKVHKPQSTIARIENGSINVTFKNIKEIANALDNGIEVRFV